MQNELTCFKAYDVRGRVPDEINEEIAYRIGCAYAQILGLSGSESKGPGKVVVGHDIRLTSKSLCDALCEGLLDSGVEVFDIGQCGTEEIYFSTFHFEMDGGIVVTASHNPKDYNGMKFVKHGSRPISGDTGLFDIKRLAEQAEFTKSEKRGRRQQLDSAQAYIEHLLSYVDLAELHPLKIVVNAGNGGAGAVIDLLESHLPFEFIKLQHEADGNFPNGVPNPLLEENRAITAEAVIAHKADLGIAWDGDFDRCFFFDENGVFVEGYYIVGLLAAAFLQDHPGEKLKVVHDPRLIWNTVDIVSSYEGVAIQSKTGHAFIKERMRKEDAVYGGEMSAHHYFRDFAYCDSGMIPWLLITGLLCSRGKSLSEQITDRSAAFPCSGEINSRIDDPPVVLKKVQAYFEQQAQAVDFTDGLSMAFADWRFNLRLSNTEPVVRLNVESRGDRALMEQKTRQILELMK